MCELLPASESEKSDVMTSTLSRGGTRYALIEIPIVAFSCRPIDQDD